VLGPKEVDRIDRAGFWRSYQQWPDAAARAMSRNLELPERSPPRLVVLAGMGGSGTACDIVSDWLTIGSDLPVAVVKDYRFPKSIAKGALVMAVSLSGETKETLSVFDQAVERGCDVVAISSGGALETRCKRAGVPHNRVEKLMVPRASLPGMVFTALRILGELGLAKVDDDIRESLRTMGERVEEVLPSVPYARNPAKKIAGMLQGKRGVIYVPARYRSIGHHFAASMNENAKTPVYVGLYPEIFHNEIETWRSAAGRAVVLLREREEEREVARRLVRAKSLLAKADIPFTEVRQEGGPLSSMLDWCILLDMASIYVAVLRKISPLETPLLDGTRQL
jgi:glucose/mannose-6-phosphate isomerase